MEACFRPQIKKVIATFSSHNYVHSFLAVANCDTDFFLRIASLHLAIVRYKLRIA